nr:cathepsin l cysteine peptidase [Hymenolepis microstoma]
MVTSKALIFLVFLVLAESRVFPTQREIDKEWFTWKLQHYPTYESRTDEQYRKRIFARNLIYIKGQNRRYRARLESYVTGLNQFADLTISEFSDRFLRTKPLKMASEKSAKPWISSFALKDLPDTVDWRDKNLVTEIKNQGNCGSCWAFSSTGALEGAFAKKTGKLISLSEQQLVDCTRTKHGNNGCNGGYMVTAFKYLENHTIESETDYPYQATDGPCRYNESLGVESIRDIGNVTEGNETSLMEAVAFVGPVSVAIDANSLGFMFYRHGIYKSHWCSSKLLNHGVLAIGYGKLKGEPYWLVKNSWGTKWGMKGYVMLAKDHRNMCGIASMANYPIV